MPEHTRLHTGKKQKDEKKKEKRVEGTLLSPSTGKDFLFGAKRFLSVSKPTGKIIPASGEEKKNTSVHRHFTVDTAFLAACRYIYISENMFFCASRPRLFWWQHLRCINGLPAFLCLVLFFCFPFPGCPEIVRSHPFSGIPTSRKTPVRFSLFFFHILFQSTSPSIIKRSVRKRTNVKLVRAPRREKRAPR